MSDHQERANGRHIVTWYHTKTNAGAYRPQFTTEIRHLPDRLEVVEIGIASSPETVARLALNKQYEIYVQGHLGSTTDEVCIGVRGETRKDKRDSVARELVRSKDRGVVERDESGRWWPPGPGHASTVVRATVVRLVRDVSGEEPDPWESSTSSFVDP
jgi:hypothetical protein